jgi:hypothetical protein
VEKKKWNKVGRSLGETSRREEGRLTVDPGSDGCTWFGHVAVGAIAQAIGRERGWLLMWLGDVAML